MQKKSQTSLTLFKMLCEQIEFFFHSDKKLYIAVIHHKMY